MQLRNARLCLDCEEVHDAQQCPSCASETFAFITRWVPAPERRSNTRPPLAEPEPPETLDTYRQIIDVSQAQSMKSRVLQGSALGLAAFGVARWMWRRNNRPDQGDEQR